MSKLKSKPCPICGAETEIDSALVFCGECGYEVYRKFHVPGWISKLLIPTFVIALAAGIFGGWFWVPFFLWMGFNISIWIYMVWIDKGD